MTTWLIDWLTNLLTDWFFDIGSSKSVPKHRYFAHFDLHMCFSPQWRANFWRRKLKKWSEADVLWTFHLKICFLPQRRAIFRHRNCKKWSDTVSFSTFSLANVLLATAACNFWFLFWPHDSAPAAWTILFNPIQTCLLYPSLMQTSFRIFDHVSRSHLVALQTGPLEKQLQTRFNTAVCCLRHEGRWLRYRLRLSA